MNKLDKKRRFQIIINFIQGVSKTPDYFWNLKTSVQARHRFRTDRHHVQWCLEFSWDGPLVSATPNWGTGIDFSKHIRLQLHIVGSDSCFKDVTLLAAVLSYCGYRNGLKKDQWKTVNYKDVHFRHLHLAVSNRYETPFCKVRAG